MTKFHHIICNEKKKIFPTGKMKKNQYLKIMVSKDVPKLVKLYLMFFNGFLTSPL